MKSYLRRLGLTIVAILLIVLGVDACDVKDDCKHYENTWTYVPVFNGKTTTITPVLSETCTQR